MDRHRRLRLVRGFPAPYRSPAGSVRRDQGIDFPLAHGGIGGGGGISSGERDVLGRSSERPVAPATPPGPLTGLTPATGLREAASGSHRTLPRSPHPSPLEGYFGRNSTLL